jgi:hypoxanthine phosphoribosyltransferase
VKQLLSAEEVQQGVARLAAEIVRVYENRPLTIIGVMTGSLLLMADLIRRLPMPLRVGVLQTSSYRGSSQRGELRIYTDGLLDIRNSDVLLVDDIFDTGHTLQRVCELLWEQRPASLRAAVLLRKLGRSQVCITPDFVAFDIPDHFVVGYGLDYRDQYRNLPYVAALEPHELAEESP